MMKQIYDHKNSVLNARGPRYGIGSHTVLVHGYSFPALIEDRELGRFQWSP